MARRSTAAATQAPAPQETEAPDAVAPPAFTTRVVRGPGRFLGVKAGDRVSVPADILADPVTQSHTMSLDEWEAYQRAKSAPRAPAPTKGLRDLVASGMEAAAAQVASMIAKG